eukprot:augustus_masked-scaffold_33-processed-gene-0.8-mRNA-1 protein AED:0.35 eAED:0.36 QI:0/-1/0/1/-1/1/1/0/716
MEFFKSVERFTKYIASVNDNVFDAMGSEAFKFRVECFSLSDINENKTDGQKKVLKTFLQLRELYHRDIITEEIPTQVDNCAQFVQKLKSLDPLYKDFEDEQSFPSSKESLEPESLLDSPLKQPDTCLTSLNDSPIAQKQIKVLKSENEELKAQVSRLAQLNTEFQEKVFEFEVERKSLEESSSEMSSKLRIEQERRKHLLNELHELKGNIRVLVRLKPAPNKRVVNQKLLRVNELDNTLVQVKGKQFTFDRVFPFDSIKTEAAQNQEVFLEVQPLVESVLDGSISTIIAYGQTNAGKTYSMNYVTNKSIELLFQLVAEINQLQKRKIKLEMSCVEVYCENVYDLLSKNGKEKIQLKDNHVDMSYVKVPLHSADEAKQYLLKVAKQRANASTLMNRHSSRSHLVTQFHLVGLKDLVTVEPKLVLVDLAGSERISRSGVQGTALKEAQSINKSLSALGDVIQNLSNQQQKSKTSVLSSSSMDERRKKDFVPYRNSKLTYWLRESLGGATIKSRCMMLVCASSEELDVNETSCSLIFGARARNCTVKAGFNHVKYSQSLYEDEVIRLKAKVKSLLGKLKEKDEENKALRESSRSIVDLPSICLPENDDCQKNVPTTPTRVLTSSRQVVMKNTPEIIEYKKRPAKTSTSRNRKSFGFMKPTNSSRSRRKLNSTYSMSSLTSAVSISSFHSTYSTYSTRSNRISYAQKNTRTQGLRSKAFR